jgi:hypothetical protein
MYGQLPLESDKLLLKMKEIGSYHKDYPALKERWTNLVIQEWSRLDRILSRDDQEKLLAGGEVGVARAIERMAKDVS